MESINLRHCSLARASPRSAVGKPAASGYGKLFGKHITQAAKGCRFDFLAGSGGTLEPAIH